MHCSRLLYPFAWLPTSAKHHGQKVTRLSDFENAAFHPTTSPVDPLHSGYTPLLRVAILQYTLYIDLYDKKLSMW